MPHIEPLTYEQIKELLFAAKARSEKDWEIFSHFVVTGARLSDAAKDLCEVGESIKIKERQIRSLFRKYSKFLSFSITPHMIRRYEACRYHQLGVHPNAISKKLGWE